MQWTDSVQRIHSILDGLDKETNNMDLEELLSVINGSKGKRRSKHQDDYDDAKDHSNIANGAFECSQQYMDEIKNALESGNDECPICLDMIENVSITVCGHRFCTECLRDLLDEREEELRRKRKSTSSRQFTVECPVCRKLLKRNQITKVVDESTQKQERDERDKKRKLKQQRNVHLSKPSSKLKKLMEILGDLHEKEPSDKV